MPLHEAKTTPLSPHDVPYQFVVFYSSIVNGTLWCPDCVDVDNTVQAAFESPNSPTALVIYVGDRQTWRDPANPFRAEPWKISFIPTVIRLRDHKEDARLEGDAIIDGLSVLVASQV